MHSITKGTKRHRYIGFHVVCNKSNYLLTSSELINALRQNTQNFFSKNIQELGLWLVKFDGTTGILKCNYREKEHTVYLLQSIKNIGSKSVTIITYATSGTIQGLTNKKIKNHR